MKWSWKEFWNALGWSAAAFWLLNWRSMNGTGDASRPFSTTDPLSWGGTAGFPLHLPIPVPPMGNDWNWLETPALQWRWGVNVLFAVAVGFAVSRIPFVRARVHWHPVAVVLAWVFLVLGALVSFYD